MTPEEWMAKAEWEGGVPAGLEYGLTHDDLDEKSGEFYETVKALVEAFRVVEPLEARLYELTPED